MKYPAIAAVLFSITTLAGCCSSGACVDSCDPCGRELANSGNPFKGLFNHKCKKCNPMSMDCGCGSGYVGGCATGHCGSYAVPGSPSPSCGCGQAHGVYAAPPAPVTQPAPAPEAAPVPLPSRTPEVPAVPPVAPNPPDEFNPTTSMKPVQQRMIPVQVTAAPQQVSYEEFQRLPGVVISQPAPTRPVLTAPQPAAAGNWAATR